MRDQARHAHRLLGQVSARAQSPYVSPLGDSLAVAPELFIETAVDERVRLRPVVRVAGGEDDMGLYADPTPRHDLTFEGEACVLSRASCCDKRTSGIAIVREAHDRCDHNRPKPPDSTSTVFFACGARAAPSSGWSRSRARRGRCARAVGGGAWPSGRRIS